MFVNLPLKLPLARAVGVRTSKQCESARVIDSVQVIYLGEASFCDNLITISEEERVETTCRATTLTVEDL